MAIKLNGVTISSNKLNDSNVSVEKLNGTVVYSRTPLSPPQGSLTDKFDYDDGPNNMGGVMLISIVNTNLEDVILNGRILGNGSDFTSEFSHFPDSGGYFFGDAFPSNTSMEYGLSVITRALWTYEWLYPITVEVWFEPASGSSKQRSEKMIFQVVNSGTTTKQWVYITSDSSEPTYQYHAYTNADTTQEDWIDALDREFPARDLAVGTMGYVTVQGDDMYRILQVQEV